jgi:hypothetical protein
MLVGLRRSLVSVLSEKSVRKVGRSSPESNALTAFVVKGVLYPGPIAPELDQGGGFLGCRRLAGPARGRKQEKECQSLKSHGFFHDDHFVYRYR